MLAIKLHVKGIVQEHAADVEKRSPRTEQQEPGDGPPIRQEPPGQTVGPDGRKIGSASQDQKRPQRRSACRRFRVHRGEEENKNRGKSKLIRAQPCKSPTKRARSRYCPSLTTAAYARPS